MPLDKSGSKASVGFNIRAERNAGKPQRQAIAIALSVARRARKKADGGSIDEIAQQPYSAISRPQIEALKEAVAPVSSIVFKDRPIPQYLPDQGKTPSLQPPGMTDVGVGVGADIAGMLPSGAGKAMFLGPMGIKALRGTTDMHPVARAGALVRAVKEQLENPDSARAIQAIRDRRAEEVLTKRAEEGNPYDSDMWRYAGMHRGEEGAIKKEIPDVGASLIPAHERGKWWLIHPQADLHKSYGIPPIKFDNQKMAPGEGAYDMGNGEITLGGNPNIPSHMRKAVGAALHEVQHAIQHKEGFSPGSSPNIEVTKPEMYSQELGRDPGQGDNFTHLGLLIGADTPEVQAARNAYRRAAGEVEAHNVQDRRAKSYRYLSHPRDTEGTPQGLQIVRKWEDIMPDNKAAGGQVTEDEITSQMARVAAADRTRRSVKHFADGGAAPWYTRQEARTASRGNAGYLNSSVPGRTDKLPINVPSGSYVVPSDVVSGMGQGNSSAGAAVLHKMFGARPGMASRLKAGRAPKGGKSSVGFADGGEVPNVPVLAAGGEYVIHPDNVNELGNGDMDHGHAKLDAFVMHMRKKTINQMKKLKPPKVN